MGLNYISGRYWLGTKMSPLLTQQYTAANCGTAESELNQCRTFNWATKKPETPKKRNNSCQWQDPPHPTTHHGENLDLWPLTSDLTFTFFSLAKNERNVSSHNHLQGIFIFNHCSFFNKPYSSKNFSNLNDTPQPALFSSLAVVPQNSC